MASLNRISLIGNAGREGELRYSANGNAVLQFSLAVADRRKNRDGQMEEQTDWFNISVFGNTAEAVSEYITKGKPVYVEGRIKLREYTDKNNVSRASLDVAASTVVLLGSRDSSDSDQPRRSNKNTAEDDDLPYE